jgi:cytochrome c oxidase subunit 2
VLVIIALVSAYPILKNQYPLPEDISTHGHLIDEQLHDTMIEAGIAFIRAQLVLADFVWSLTGRAGSPLKNFGGARVLVIFAFVIVGLEVLALGAFGQKAWASVYFTPAKADSLQIQAQAEQFAFYFRYAGPDGKFGQIHPEKIDEGNQNYFGLDPENDVAARDDIVSGELVVPVNREIHLMLHGKDVGHSFFVRELCIQQDFVRGLDLLVHFTAPKRGMFELVCTQLCGLGHYNMKAYLNVMSQADYDNWFKQQSAQ